MHFLFKIQQELKKNNKKNNNHPKPCMPHTKQGLEFTNVGLGDDTPAHCLTVVAPAMT